MSKRILIGDIHFGEHHNSEQHNQDLLDFFKFVIAYGAEHGITKLSMLGDYFDNRSTIGVSTLNYAILGVEMLTQAFDCTFLPGNHDLFYRDSRDISSLEMFRPKVKLIDALHYDAAEKTLYVPWILTPDEYKAAVTAAKHHKAEFVFGHFEASSFRMNNKFNMEGFQDPSMFSFVKHVFSSHYHDRQTKGNFTYIGNPFPFDYGDANATNRGFCVQDADAGEHYFVDYKEIAILSVSHSAFLSPEFTVTNPKTSMQVIVDEVISDETTQAIQDKLATLPLRSSQIIYKTTAIKELLNQDIKEISTVKNLDELVLEYLTNMTDIESIDKQLMVSLYKEALAQETA